MRYMLLIYGDPAAMEDPSTPAGRDRHEAWMRISDEMRPITQAGAALQPTTTATTVRVDDGGERVLSDGPFAETKELLGGFYVIDVPDLDTALDWAAKLPIHPHGSVEVRPVAELGG